MTTPARLANSIISAIRKMNLGRLTTHRATGPTRRKEARTMPDVLIRGMAMPDRRTAELMRTELRVSAVSAIDIVRIAISCRTEMS